MKKFSFGVTAISASAFLLIGCMDPDGTRNNVGLGVGVGSTVGGLIGNRLAGDADRTKGTVVGAVVGGAIGGVIGSELEKQEAELRGQLGGTGATIVNTGDRLIVTLPEAITFPTNSSEIKSSLYGPLASLAQNLNNYPNTIAQIVGHTDNVGSASYNQDLSKRRASSVANNLISNGVPIARVRTVGMGLTSPIASNATEAGRAQNRRVEINIIPQQ